MILPIREVPMSTALVFSSAPNPAPYSGATVEWTAGHYDDGSYVQWSAEPAGIVMITPHGDANHQATLTVKAFGFALITVTQSNRLPASRYVTANEILGYDNNGTLMAAQSQFWTEFGQDSAAPPFRWSGGYQSYCLDITQLNAIRGDTTGTVFFDVTVGSRAEQPPENTVPAPLLIVGPDGSLWKTGDDGWQVVPSSQRPDVPPFDQIKTLAWAPPGEMPTEPSFNVTCYILNLPGMNDVRGDPDYNVAFDVALLP